MCRWGDDAHSYRDLEPGAWLVQTMAPRALFAAHTAGAAERASFYLRVELPPDPTAAAQLSASARNLRRGARALLSRRGRGHGDDSAVGEGGEEEAVDASAEGHETAVPLSEEEAEAERMAWVAALASVAVEDGGVIQMLPIRLWEGEAEEVSSPRHKYPDRIPDLAEISLRF
jgi:hypothetical protein